MRIVPLLAAGLSLAFLSGCATPPKYNWGNYDGSLYGYYKDPTRLETHVTEMENIIRASEQAHTRVAPGIHAEYGYFLMQNGKNSLAVVQFEKEKASWPESTQLMSSMIRLAQAQSDKPLAAKDQ